MATKKSTPIPMNPIARAEWLAALRSGTYRQGFGVLRTFTDEPSYCCLGVLTDVAARHGVVAWDGGMAKDCDGKNSSSALLTPGVQQWAFGTTQKSSPWFNGSPIVPVNDLVKASFDAIADIIEEGSVDDPSLLPEAVTI